MKWLTTTITTTNNNLMTKLCVHTDDMYMYMMTFIFFHHANLLSYIM